jgi:hypothetical protein
MRLGEPEVGTVLCFGDEQNLICATPNHMLLVDKSRMVSMKDICATVEKCSVREDNLFNFYDRNYDSLVHCGRYAITQHVYGTLSFRLRTANEGRSNPMMEFIFRMMNL